VDITNADLVALRNILPPIIAAVPGRAAKLKYRLSKNYTRVLQEIADFDKAEKDIVDAFTTKDEDGKPVHPEREDGTPDPSRITLTDPAAFTAARNELLSATVSVDLMAIPVSWFEGIDAPTDGLFLYCDFLLVDDSE